MTICSRPPLCSSMVVLPRTLQRCRARSRRMDWMPASPSRLQPVGKSGPLMCSRISSVVMSGLSTCAQMASMTSPRLCGGMLVAMPTAMPVPPLTSRFGNAAGKTVGFGGRFVVVGDEIDRVLLHVVHQGRAEVGQPRLGVTHGGGRVALDAAEVALAVDEPFAHGPGLGHVDQRGVDDRLAVGMVIARGVAADLGAFTVLPAGKQREVVHRVEDAALGGLEAVARVGQGAGDDDGHRVVEEGLGHLLGHVDGLDFLVGIGHGENRGGRCCRAGTAKLPFLAVGRQPKTLGVAETFGLLALTRRTSLRLVRCKPRKLSSDACRSRPLPPLHGRGVLSMEEVGILAPDARVELLDGKSSICFPSVLFTPASERGFTCFARPRMDAGSFASQYPIRLNDGSEPVPDLALVKPREDFYTAEHPRAERTCFLLVEVADSSRAFRSQSTNCIAYARAGIRGVLDREPEGEVRWKCIGGRCPLASTVRTSRRRRGDTIAPIAFPDVADRRGRPVLTTVTASPDACCTS